jgi:hypothetical protein
MSRFLHNDKQGYDSETDTWFGFESAEQAKAWRDEDLAGITASHDLGADDGRVDHVVEVAPTFNAWSLTLTCPVGATVGPVTSACQGDQGRLRAVLTAIGIPAGAFILVGTREAVLSGQGFPLANGALLELKNTHAAFAALALGTASAPIAATIGVLVESTVG